jgi:DNA-binding NarL/FixJ family response regulator
VLVARSGRPRTFSEHDVNFLHAVANVLAAAMARDEAEEALNEAREAERRRIARDLHDGALRELSTVTVQADAALAPALQRVGEQLRRAVYDLRMGAEEDRPLGERLTGLVAVHRPIALPCAVELEIGDGVPAHALGARGTEILRIVGEALTNAIRHARARHVHVRVRGSGGTLTAEVCDDGCGIAPGVPEGAGMRGMRERAELLEAGLTIRSGPGSGTTVRVDVQAGDEPVAGIRVLLVEDHAAVREAMAAAFAGEAGFAVVGQAGSLAEARGMLDGVDVAVIDLGLPDGYGPDLIDDLRAASPWAHALVLTASIDRADIAGAVQHGAAGAMSKAVHFDEVVRAVRRLRAGEALLPADEVMEFLRSAGRREEDDAAARRALSRLTRRERDVLQAMADGLDSEAVAARLHITLRTQRTHMTRILAKLGVHSALQALVVALRYEVVQARGGPVS